ncbi:MAG: hypothetical protein JW910_19365 [Anaerolineae bacterium]|nr:hypothetical protein [Anaerolineae bacterium]
MSRAACFSVFLAISVLALAACGGVIDPVIPTAFVSPTPTGTLRPTDTPAVTPTEAPTRRVPATGGPSPTPLIGPSRTPPPNVPTSTPRPNPNAPRIEYFTADPVYVFPGDPLTLRWSIRGADRGAIYRLDDTGQRSQLWNIEPTGSLVVPTRRSDRGTAHFLLTVDAGAYYVEQALEVPLLCAYPWFFEPQPVACAASPETNSTHIEQLFQGGRMVYVEAEDVVYALFGDGRDPAWTFYANRYVGGQTPDEDPNFVPPPDLFEPTRILGLVWRGSDIVRNRLQLGLAPETTYEGAIQADGDPNGPNGATIYIRSADGSVLQLNPRGRSWEVVR